MSNRALGTGLLVSLLAGLTAAWAAPADSAAIYYRIAKEALSRADFEAALQAFESAAKADPENAEYAAQAALVRRIIDLRQSLERQSDDQKWLAAATALFSFYMDNGIEREALSLALKAHTRQPTAETAAMLARARLALNQNTEAAQELRSLAAEKMTAEVRALLGIALARQNQVDQAKALLSELKLPEKPAAYFLFDLARLHALVGDRNEALHHLVSAFENTPPTQLNAAKDRARKEPDFQSLRDDPGFAQALQTASKVTDEGCPYGQKHENCPKKATCPAAKAGKDHNKGKSKKDKP
jgi:tetratricopeptide (TPR) repeat protein